MLVNTHSYNIYFIRNFCNNLISKIFLNLIYHLLYFYNVDIFHYFINIFYLFYLLETSFSNIVEYNFELFLKTCYFFVMRKKVKMSIFHK